MLCEDHVLIPPGLKEEVLEGLHAAHHGVVPMTNRAQGEFIWPCITAIQNVLTNPRDLPEEPVIPNMPFELVCMDFSDGRLAICCYQLLSLIISLVGVKSKERRHGQLCTAGSPGLTSAMQQVFTVFGVTSEVSSDVGPEFLASKILDLFDC